MSKILITPIGTCRINTPLKRGAVRYPVKLDYKRTYGFVHTSAEVTQQLKYRSGTLDVPEAIQPLLFRPGWTPESGVATSDDSDLTVVEISSSKSCFIGDFAVQTNYIVRHFNDLLPSNKRVRAFWDIIARDDRQELQEFLSSREAMQFCSAEDRDLLSQLRFHKQNYDEVFADMAAIVDTIGANKLLFVTHVNGRGPDGELIASRDRLIRWVKLGAERLGVECFDPTTLMLEIGQERALEKEGLDLTHLTNAFYDRWYGYVQREYILPNVAEGVFQADDDSASDAAILTESISAAIAYDDFFDGTRQMFAALKSYPEYAPLRLLQAQVLARIGDYKRASEIFSNFADSTEMTAETRQSYMRVLIETDKNQEALAIAQQLLMDEYEHDEIYDCAGKASERLGRFLEAVRYRKLAFRFNPAATDAAISVLDHYRKSGEQDHYDAWLEEVVDLTEAGGNAASARAVAEWALENREPGTFARAFAVLSKLDTSSLPRLIGEANDTDMLDALAQTAETFSGMTNLTDRLGKSFRNLAQKWTDSASALSTDDNLEEASRLIEASLSLSPSNRAARLLQRDLVTTLREQLLEHADRPEEVVEIGRRAGDLVFARRGTSMIYARALVATKNMVEAEEAYERLLEDEPEDLSIRATLAHAASVNGNFVRALELYHELWQLGEDGVGRYWARVERFMQKVDRTAVHALRAKTAECDFGGAVQLAKMLRQLDVMTDRLPAELERVRRAIRGYLRQQTENGLGPEETLELLTFMLWIEPNDAAIVRRAAIESMKATRWQQALELWERHNRLVPDQPSTLSNIKRCQIFVQRQTRKRRTGKQVAA